LDKTSESNETKPDEIVNHEKEDNTKKSHHDKKKEETGEKSDTEKETKSEPEEEPIEGKQKQEQKKQKHDKAKPDESNSEKKDLKKKDENFQYIIRIANTDIDGNKNIIHGLTSIKGVGMHIATLIADTSGVDTKLKMGDLSEAQIEKIRKAIEDLETTAPSWMLNHRKDYETGKNMHLIGTEIDTRLRDEINIMKKIRSYRGIRHERGLPVRGQRTRANNRTGLALGVSKKREPAAAAKDEKKD
jgi:small subunit ribosomal protein S13